MAPVWAPAPLTSFAAVELRAWKDRTVPSGAKLVTLGKGQSRTVALNVDDWPVQRGRRGVPDPL